MRVLRKWMLLLSLAFAPLPALGQSNCGGFIDVSPADFFCNNVEWIANRLVTLGCTATEYCPNNFVLRSQMAAFLNRLGDALTPTILRTTDVRRSTAPTTRPCIVGCISDAGSPITEFPAPGQLRGNADELQRRPPRRRSRASWSSRRTLAQTGIPRPATSSCGRRSTRGADDARARRRAAGPGRGLDAISSRSARPRTIRSRPFRGECQLNVRIESRTGTSTPF